MVAIGYVLCKLQFSNCELVHCFLAIFVRYVLSMRRHWLLGSPTFPRTHSQDNYSGKDVIMTALPPCSFSVLSNGYDFSGAASVTILPSVVIGSDRQFGLSSTLALNPLLNQGVIYSNHSIRVNMAPFCLGGGDARWPADPATIGSASMRLWPAVDRVTSFRHGPDKNYTLSGGPRWTRTGRRRAPCGRFPPRGARSDSLAVPHLKPGQRLRLYYPHDSSPQDHFVTLSPYLVVTHSDFVVLA
jgi:hypothetical protein